MNILEQEDMVKGLPDDILMQQAQNPSNQLPQFLVVSEIQRREKMRKSYAEAVPEESIKDQVISSGLASMSPELDPLMASAMGAQGGQDPMQQQMQPPMQQPMQQMQQPMQQQMQPPMQDPMMQQQMMAAGGGMMPYRMEAGREVPFPELQALIDQLISEGIPPGEAEILATTSENSYRDYGVADVSQGAFDPEAEALGLLDGPESNILESITKGGVSDAINVDTAKADNVSLASEELITANPAGGIKVNNKVKEAEAAQRVKEAEAAQLAAILAKYGGDPQPEPLTGMAGISQSLAGVPFPNFKSAEADFAPIRERINENRDALLSVFNENKPDYTAAYDDDKNKPNVDFSGFAPDYATLIADAERRATGIRDDAKKDSGYQALIALGAGISEGKLGQGIRDAGTRMTDIRSQARKEASAESQLARRMELAGEESKMSLGMEGQKAGNVEATRRREAITKQFNAERESELAQAGVIAKAAERQAALETKIIEADYSRGTDEYNAKIDSFVKQGALLRYGQLEAQSRRSLDRSILTAISSSIGEAFKTWNDDNYSKSAEVKANYLKKLLDQFVTIDKYNEYSNRSDSQTGMRIVR